MTLSMSALDTYIIFILQSVVSACVEPDTIVLDRNENDEVRIDSINSGQKSQKVVMTGKETYEMFKKEKVRFFFFNACVHLKI